MEDVGEAWLMTSLSSSTLLVALVETAGSLPMVLLAIQSEGHEQEVFTQRRKGAKEAKIRLNRSHVCNQK
jgi:Transmembrane secretion effector